MHNSPNLPLSFRLHLLLLLAQQLHSFPTINQPLTQHNIYTENLNKVFYQPRELEDTIEEVQKILAQDPSLPRLTRGEIEELYEKVTREEYLKSIEAGDMGRADSMRALMLVLPYNTDNNTEDNLQDLYTRPPVTKVIDAYTPPQPIKFISPDPNSSTKVENAPIGNLAATTYKPIFSLKTAQAAPNPTTYHPQPPPIMYKMTSSIMKFKPVTNVPLMIEYGANVERSEILKPLQRYSSHYNARNAEFLKLPNQRKTRPQTTTVKPVADVLESLGIVGQAQSRNRLVVDDYYVAESAPKPIISSYVPQTVNIANLKDLRSQGLAPKIRPDAYASFKPLNIGEEIRAKPEVEGYLTRFGIVGGRKRKDLKKGYIKDSTSEEQASEESEIATAKVPSNRKSATDASNSELQKLLVNLKELERLNVNPKTVAVTKTTSRPSTTTKRTTTTSATTTSTTTEAPTTPNLITNGVPLLIEPKKPRRRLDPNIDIYFGASGNQQTEQGNGDQLSKLLENLQELEKLKINPENVLKSAAPATKASSSVTKPISTATAANEAPVRTQAISNRFSNLAFPQQVIKSSVQNDTQQLQQVLQELQAFEQSNARTTTKKPKLRDIFAPTDLFQLQKLLTDDRELERLYEKARAKQTARAASTTTTTRKPSSPSLSELEQLQKYFAQLDRAPVQKTTTTTLKPTTQTADLDFKSKKSVVESDQLDRLLNREHQLERLNNRKPDSSKITPTETNMPFLGFTSRNVNSPTPNANDYRVAVNEFAHLQELYKQVQQAEQASFRQIEISTAATAPKSYHQQDTKRTQNFAQRIIDISNDTGSRSSLQEVDPNDFVQFQKLLSKVQELERVKINSNGIVHTKSHREPTVSPNLVTSASVLTSNIQNLDGAEIVFPKTNVYNNQTEDSTFNDQKLNLPAYQITTSKTHVNKNSNPSLDLSSSEELRDSAFSSPANPKNSVLDKEFEQYQQFFANLEDTERNLYKNIEPPMIYKTVTKEPPRFVATHKPQYMGGKKKNSSNQQQADLEELQKLLNNAQELEKLGITLPTELSKQIEYKLIKTGNIDMGFKWLQTSDVKPTSLTSTELLGPPEVAEYMSRYGIIDTSSGKLKKATSTSSTTIATTITPKIESTSEEEPYDSSERTAVFSLTTMKSLVPKEPKLTTESTLELPVFSATKIIEAAIKRAANKIGVSTEHPNGFRRRSDDDMLADNGDLMGEFSEMNYQIAIPEINGIGATTVNDKRDNGKFGTTSEDPSQDITEVQRLINNLQELQKLNISILPDMLGQADVRYLKSFTKPDSEDDSTKKNRRQSATPSAASNSVTAELSSNSSSTTLNAAPQRTTPASTRINLDLKLDDPDTDVAASDKEMTITTESSSPSTTTEESQNGSLADLEDSFGPDPNKEEELPAKKKNGFYFLADWNSFLEVGYEDDQVIVRLSPKIGDPRLFLPVKIP